MRLHHGSALAALALSTFVSDRMAASETPAPPPASQVRTAVRQWRQEHAKAILDELRQFASLPNVARDRADMDRNAAFIQEMLQRRGIQSQRLAVPGSPPAVMGERNVEGATETVLLYAHYDGQPVGRG